MPRLQGSYSKLVSQRSQGYMLSFSIGKVEPDIGRFQTPPGISHTTLSEHLSDIGMAFLNPTKIQGTFYQQKKPELPVNLLQRVPYFWL